MADKTPNIFFPGLKKTGGPNAALIQQFINAVSGAGYPAAGKTEVVNVGHGQTFPYFDINPTGLTFRPGAQGYAGPNPRVLMAGGLNPLQSEYTMAHEMGHVLEPSLVRNRSRADQFLDIVGMPRGNTILSATPQGRTELARQGIPRDEWGLPAEQTSNEYPLSPLEQYAEIARGQLGSIINKRGDDHIRQVLSIYGLNPAPNLGPDRRTNTPDRMGQLVRLGLMPKAMPKFPINDFSLGS